MQKQQGPADLLDLAPGYAFWREGCASLISNVCEMLTLAELELEKDAFVEFIRSLPAAISNVDEMRKWSEDSFCDQCCRKAYDLTQGKESHKRVKELLDYFFEYLPERRWNTRLMLADSVIGVLNGLERGASITT